jgi:subtilisin family serine protease
LKNRSFDDAVDYTDLPVERTYVERLGPFVKRVRQVTKWFNGASVLATKAQIERLGALPFVARMELVTRFKRNNTEELTTTPEHPLAKSQQMDEPNVFDYGPSFAQLNQINVPAVHNMGNYGQGVIVGSFDNGFRLLNHQAFDSLRPRIVATYDYVDHKVSVVPNNPDPGFGAHGIITLSALAGFRPGELIGPAFGASFILARTENDSSETPVEEDNWLAAMEWADSLGVDVTSTSLGYLTYDPPYTSWTWENMDGNTTVITRASDLAVRKGIVVCNSAGNNGYNPSHNTLNAPADADSILSIGAANPDGSRAGFSSHGPTLSNPPRIKPDVMAQGVTVRCASPVVDTGYTYSSGTSLSCPLAAGVAALLIHANPHASALEIMQAMRMTASNASSPDNLIGWGILNALSAITTVTGGEVPPPGFVLMQNFPNPFNPKTKIRYRIPEAAFVSLKIFDVLGQEVKTLVNQIQSQDVKTIEWNGTNNDGNVVASGVYFARMTAAAVNTNATFAATKKLVFLR